MELSSEIYNLCSSACDGGPYNDLFLLKHYVKEEDTASIVFSSLNRLIEHYAKPSQWCATLNALMEFSPASAVREHCADWINIIFNVGQPIDSKIDLIRKIVQSGGENEEFRKVFVTKHLKNTLDLCLSSSAEELLSALDCLSACLQEFSYACGLYKSQLEKFLLSFLDIQIGSEQVTKAGLAFHYLQKVGDGGTDGSIHIKNWRSEFLKLCITAGTLATAFLKNSMEPNTTGIFPIDPHTFPIVPSTAGTDIRRIICKRLRNCFIFLKMMFDTPFVGTKMVYYQTIVCITKNTLTLHWRECSERNSTALIKTQNQVLKFFWTVITKLRVRLAPSSEIITKFLIDSIYNSQRCHCFINKSWFCTSAYTVLKSWIQVGAENFDKMCQQKFIVSVLANVEHASKDMNTRVALECLNEFLLSVQLKIGSKYSVKLYEFFINTICSMQDVEEVHPYRNSACEADIYESMICLFHQPFLKVPFPLHIGMKLLYRGQFTRNKKLLWCCHKGLELLGTLGQPVHSDMFINRPSTTGTTNYQEAEPPEIYSSETESASSTEEFQDYAEFLSANRLNLPSNSTESRENETTDQTPEESEINVSSLSSDSRNEGENNEGVSDANMDEVEDAKSSRPDSEDN